MMHDFRGNIHLRNTPGASFEWAHHYPRSRNAWFIIRAGGYDAVRENSRSR